MLSDDDIAFLRETFDRARAARERGTFPFSAIVVNQDREVLARVDNTVLTDGDPTAHAEVNAVRAAAAAHGADALKGATIYVNAEPCAMCAGAIHWAGLGRLVFGLGTERLYALDPGTYSPLVIGAEEVLASGGIIEIEGPCLETEAEGPHRAEPA